MDVDNCLRSLYLACYDDSFLFLGKRSRVFVKVKDFKLSCAYCMLLFVCLFFSFVYRSGRNCECDPRKTRALGQDKGCKRTNSTNVICDGNGDCDCGKCQCNLIGVSYMKTLH